MPRRGWRKADGVWVPPVPGSLGAVGTVSDPPEVSRETVIPHYWQGVPGHFWYREAYTSLLGELAAREEPWTWVEVGVFEGQALSWLGVEVVNRRLPGTIVAVDTFAGWPGTKRGAVLREAFLTHTAPVRKVLGERFRVIEAPSVVAAQQFATRSLDVVWLDGDHDHTAVRADIAAWGPKVRGVIGGDDWLFPGVRDAVKATGRFELIPGSQDGREWPSWLRRVG